jgi:pseudaminic acid synthase
MKIAGREIGNEPYIVCELSGNHGGTLEGAIRLLEAAAATGADAIKIQSYTPDTITIDHDGPEFRIEGGLWGGRTLYDLYTEAHTPFGWHPALFARAKELGVTLFSSPFDETAVDMLEELGCPAYKIASFEIADLELIGHVAKKGKPIIISTGMASYFEIASALAMARTYGSGEIALLHCVSSYPTRIEDANVTTVQLLANDFGCIAGLSDHTLGNAASIAAVALGASIIEKHFTLSRAGGGPDAEFSLEPDEFTELVAGCKDAWRSLGRPTLGLGTERKLRRSLYVVEDIAAGEPFTTENVRSIRPGLGMSPDRLRDMLGKYAPRGMHRGEPLQLQEG